MLAQNGSTPNSGTWGYGAGRAVYLGPIYLAEYLDYDNEPLLDGSLPDAQQLFINSVEWAGQYHSPALVPSLSQWALLGLAAALAGLAYLRLVRRRISES